MPCFHHGLSSTAQVVPMDFAHCIRMDHRSAHFCIVYRKVDVITPTHSILLVVELLLQCIAGIAIKVSLLPTYSVDTTKYGWLTCDKPKLCFNLRQAFFRLWKTSFKLARCSLNVFQWQWKFFHFMPVSTISMHEPLGITWNLNNLSMGTEGCLQWLLGRSISTCQ